MKLKELYKIIERLVDEGHGNKDCYVITDEEGNDYRPMYFEPTANPVDIASLMEYSCSGIGNNNPSKIVMFG